MIDLAALPPPLHFWRCRQVVKGPYVGVVTWLGPPLIDGEQQDRSHRWQALIRNETTGRMIFFGEPCPIEVDGVFLRNTERVSESDYKHLVSHSDWATRYRPDMPDASPTTTIDWNKTRPAI